MALLDYILTGVNSVFCLVTVFRSGAAHRSAFTASMDKETAQRVSIWAQQDYKHMRELANEFGQRR